MDITNKAINEYLGDFSSPESIQLGHLVRSIQKDYLFQACTIAPHLTSDLIQVFEGPGAATQPVVNLDKIVDNDMRIMLTFTMMMNFRRVVLYDTAARQRFFRDLFLVQPDKLSSLTYINDRHKKNRVQ